MPVKAYRQRIRPQFKRGLRKGKERDTMTEWLARHPDVLERLLRHQAEMEARGILPADMRRVKQPFDYD
jgi:hypothetical protein